MSRLGNSLRAAAAKEAERVAARDRAENAPGRSAYANSPAGRRALMRSLGITPVVVNPDYDVAAIRRDSFSDAGYRRSLTSKALAAIERAAYPGLRSPGAAQDRLDRLLRQVDDDATRPLAHRVLVTGSPVYRRAWSKAVMAGSDVTCDNEERAALALGVDSTGGYAVPFDLDPTLIITGAGAESSLRDVATVVQTSGKSWHGVTAPQATAARSAEAAENSDVSPTLTQPDVTPTRVQSLVVFSSEIGQDWVALQTAVSGLLTDAKASEEASSFFLGAGTGTAPLGIVTGVAAVSGSVVTTASAGALVAADVTGTAEALPARHVARAGWMGAKLTFNRVRAFGETPMWSLGANTPELLLRSPVYEAAKMDTALTAGKNVLMYGDFQRFLIVDGLGMGVELVPNLIGTGSNFPTGQRGVLGVWRSGTAVTDPDAFRVLQLHA